MILAAQLCAECQFADRSSRLRCTQKHDAIGAASAATTGMSPASACRPSNHKRGQLYQCSLTLSVPWNISKCSRWPSKGENLSLQCEPSFLPSALLQSKHRQSAGCNSKLSLCRFTGTLPTESIANMTSLQLLDLSANQFTGFLPSSWSNLTQVASM